jgi:dipeptide/tripeptide permease
MTTAALLVAIGMLWLSAVTVNASYLTDVFGPLVVLSLGLGMAFVSTSITAISGVQPNESGLASALLNVGRQLGGSIGIAVMGTVAATAGFSSAFEIAGAIAIAGFVIALIAVRHRHSPAVAAPIAEEEVAA